MYVYNHSSALASLSSFPIPNQSQIPTDDSEIPVLSSLKYFPKFPQVFQYYKPPIITKRVLKTKYINNPLDSVLEVATSHSTEFYIPV